MPKIEFLYEATCPNVAGARDVLRAALAQSGLPAHWQEWEHSDPAAPDQARRYGSPTILVDGLDVAGEPPSDEPNCRIYTNASGRARGVPSMDLIMNALKPHKPARSVITGKSGGRALAFLPAAGAALLPKLSCPACWPAYAALLSSLGVGFVDYTPWLFPATAVFLVITLAMLAWQPRGGYWPLILGIGASAIVLAGKFSLDSNDTVYAGIALLAASSAWNAWPMRREKCSACSKQTAG